jgi:hypothetical protein
VTDYLKVSDGQLKCTICGATNFESQSAANDHVTKEHDIAGNGGDFEGDDSDDSVKQEADSSDESDGSSGVESSEVESAHEECDSDDPSSSKRSKPSTSEPQEVKNSRAILVDQGEALKHNFSSKVLQWTRDL